MITGGNSGIGLATARALAAAGADVVLTSRDPTRGAAAVASIEAATGVAVTAMALDLGSFASIRAFAADFLAQRDALHLLINNAGLILSERRTTEDGFEQTFGVNHLGHFLLTDLLRERLVASAPARIVNVASRAHRRAKRGLDFDDLMSEGSYEGMDVYAKSKLANIYFTVELARRLEGTGVTANSLHPGVVATGFAADGDAKGLVAWFFKLGRPFLRTADEGAATSLYVAQAPELEGVTGEYFSDCAPGRPTKIAEDEAAAERLWIMSEALVAGVPAP